MAKKVNILDRFQEKIRNSFSEIKTKTSYNDKGEKIVESFNENTGEQITKVFSHDGLDRTITKTNYVGAESVIVEKNSFFYLQNLNNFEKTVYIRFGENEMVPARKEFSDSRLKGNKTLVLFNYDKNYELISKETLIIGFTNEKGTEKVFTETILEKDGNTQKVREIYSKSSEVMNNDIYRVLNKFSNDLYKNVDTKKLPVEREVTVYENNQILNIEKYNKFGSLIEKTEFLNKDETKIIKYENNTKKTEVTFYNNVIDKMTIYSDKIKEIFYANGKPLLEITKNNEGKVETVVKNDEQHNFEYLKDSKIIDKLELSNGNLEIRTYSNSKLDSNDIPIGKYSYEVIDENGKTIENGIVKSEFEYKSTKYDQLGNKISEVESGFKGKEMFSKETHFDKNGNKIIEFDTQNNKVEITDSKTDNVTSNEQKEDEKIENNKYNRLENDYDSAECFVN